VDELDIDYGGDTIEIGFNVTYLIDALANMSARRWSDRAADGSADHPARQRQLQVRRDADAHLSMLTF
jgi:DNA polymerase III sliding clamp (beta) subunit (PCNA family)